MSFNNKDDVTMDLKSLLDELKDSIDNNEVLLGIEDINVVNSELCELINKIERLIDEKTLN